MSKHSPAPWLRDEKNQWIIRDFRGATLCEMYPWDVSGCGEDDQADANLVAAAPELLEALQTLVDLIHNDDWFGEWRKIAQEAIAKAKGE